MEAQYNMLIDQQQAVPADLVADNEYEIMQMMHLLCHLSVQNRQVYSALCAGIAEIAPLDPTFCGQTLCLSSNTNFKV